MPTGYTSYIDDGKVTDLKGFAMRCARAFGATITMRDDSPDAPIPEEFEPSTYHVKALAEASKALAKFTALSDNQLHKEYEASEKRRQKEHETSVKEYTETQAKYDKVAAEVRSWKPPTPDHHGLKNFMLEQLNTGKPFNPGPFTATSFETWKVQQESSLRWNVDYHAKQDAEEKSRAASRTQWVKDLRESLGV